MRYTALFIFRIIIILKLQYPGSHSPEHAEDFTQDQAVIDDDGVHGVILGLKTNMTVLFIESLDSRSVLNESYNDLAVSRGITGTYEEQISVEDTGVDHGFSADAKSKGLSGRKDLSGDREIALDVLLSKDRLSCSYITHHGQRCHFCADHLKTVITDLDRPGFGGISPYVSVSLERRKMRVHGRCGFKSDFLADLAHCRRISLGKYLILEIVKDFLLLPGNLSGH